ncbi:hypothetical protein Syun_006649 [Stephania yunnanensis]|uniref:Uncharacterized protein n=1 Tax=Stephania yunnanensis TaxID=152371 RepID=A0AAP0KYF6_9MAGN
MKLLIRPVDDASSLSSQPFHRRRAAFAVEPPFAGPPARAARAVRSAVRPAGPPCCSCIARARARCRSEPFVRPSRVVRALLSDPIAASLEPRRCCCRPAVAGVPLRAPLVPSRVVVLASEPLAALVATPDSRSSREPSLAPLF